MMFSNVSRFSPRPTSFASTPNGSPPQIIRFGQHQPAEPPSSDPQDQAGRISMAVWIPTVAASLTVATAIGLGLWTYGERIFNFLFNGLR